MAFDTSPIDGAFEELKKICAGVCGLDGSLATEADTRLNLIDPVLKLLGWMPGQIQCERTQDALRVDYILRTVSSTAVVEAKRESVLFDLGQTDGPRKYSLNSIYLKSGTAGKAVAQVKEYAQELGIGLAVATNGLQWVVFLASRNDGVPPNKGFAYVFRSLEDLLEPKTFKLFYELLSKRSVQMNSYKAHFEVAEQLLRSPKPPSAQRLVDSRRGNDQKRMGSGLAEALAPVLEELFLNLSKEREREIVRNCFVTTKESVEADNRLERLITEITNRIQPLDTRSASDNKLTEVVEQSIEAVGSQTVLLIGHMGAGKSTFLDRFFEVVLPSQLKKKVLLVRIDLENAQPNPIEFTPFLHREFISELKRVAFKSEAPDFDDLRGAFNSLYEKRKRGEFKYLYQTNQGEFNTAFGKMLLDMEEHHQEEYIRELLKYCNVHLGKLVCVVMDNVDHHEDDIQTRAFLSSKWINGLGKVLCLLPLRDTTYWQASTDGPFHARNQTTLYLPRPPLADVLRARFKYAELQLDDLEENKPIVITSLKGFRVKAANAKQLFQCFHKLFGREIKPNLIIRGLSGGNIREALRLFYVCMTSPHMNIDRLLAAYLSDGQFRLNQRDMTSFEKAAIFGDWHCYKQERSKTIANLFCFPRQFNNTPVMGLRVLERLYDLKTDSTQSHIKGFENIENLMKYFESMGIPLETTDRAILSLINARLIEPYNLSVLTEFGGLESTEKVKSVAISDAGRLHRYWARRSFVYGLAMLEDTDIYDDTVFGDLTDLSLRRQEAFRKKDYGEVKSVESQLSLVARRYLASRDAEFVEVPTLDIYSSQSRLLNVVLNWTATDSDEAEQLQYA